MPLGCSHKNYLRYIDIEDAIETIVRALAAMKPAQASLHTREVPRGKLTMLLGLLRGVRAGLGFCGNDHHA